MISKKQTLELLKHMALLFPYFRIPTERGEAEFFVSSWANALNRDVDWPAHVYQEALDSYFASLTGRSSTPVPGDIREHCRKVIERIESDPVRGPKLREWREQRRLEREQQFLGG